MSRARRTAYGIAADLAFQVVFVVTGFLTTPWIVRWLGTEAFGAFRTLLDWLSVLGGLEWGLGGALMSALALSLGRADEARVRSLLRAGASEYVRLTAWMLACAVGLTILAPSLFAETSLPSVEIRAAAAISAASLLLTPLQLFRSVAEARQLHYRVTLAMLVQTLVLNAAWLSAAAAGWGLVGQAIGLVAAQACGFSLLAWQGRSEVTGLISEPLRVEERSSLRRQSASVLAIGLADRLLLASGTLTVGWLLGPAAVVPLFLTLRLGSVARAQLKAVADSSWAGLVEIHVSGDGSTMRERLTELTSAVSGVAAAILAAVIAFNDRFVGLWIGSTLYAGDAVTLLGALDAWMLSLYGLWVAPIFGMGELRRWLPFGLSFAAVALTAGAFLTPLVGVSGPLLGIAIGFAGIVSWSLPALLGSLSGVRPGDLWSAALRPLLWAVPWTGFLFAIVRPHMPGGWTGLGVTVVGSTAVGLALWWLVTLDRARRSLWIVRARSVFA